MLCVQKSGGVSHICALLPHGDDLYLLDPHPDDQGKISIRLLNVSRISFCLQPKSICFVSQKTSLGEMGYINETDPTLTNGKKHGCVRLALQNISRDAIEQVVIIVFC